MQKPDTDPRPPAIVVTGPTASGKSGLALAIAEQFDGVVINADSMQVYRELSVLTARPDAATMRRVPHRLYGVLPGSERCSAGRWRAMALAEIAGAQAEGRLPLVVGGTGFYLRALEGGLDPIPEVPAETREAAREMLAELGAAGFHAALAARDPVMAARLRPGDAQRVVRAWEVLEATGRSLADWQTGGAGKSAADRAPYRFLRIVCLPPRAVLYAACDARFRAMVSAGALDEVRALNALGLNSSLPVMKALGVPELSRHLAGEVDLETAIAEAQRATRNYAKRQITWMRTQLPKDDAGDASQTMFLSEQFSESLLPNIFSKIRQFLLTGVTASD
jgi:tRNA dimethylallyltransferase